MCSRSGVQILCAALAYPTPPARRYAHGIVPTLASFRSISPSKRHHSPVQHFQQPRASKWLLLPKRWSPLARPRRRAVSFLPQPNSLLPFPHMYPLTARPLTPARRSAPHLRCVWGAAPALLAATAVRLSSHPRPLRGVTTVPIPKINSGIALHKRRAGTRIPPHQRAFRTPPSPPPPPPPSEPLVSNARALPKVLSRFLPPSVHHGVAFTIQSEPYSQPLATPQRLRSRP